MPSDVLGQPVPGLGAVLVEQAHPRPPSPRAPRPRSWSPPADQVAPERLVAPRPDRRRVSSAAAPRQVRGHPDIVPHGGPADPRRQSIAGQRPTRGAAMGEFVRLEVADGVGTIRLDRPKMNALNVQVQEEIRAAAAEATDRDDVRAVVVYGGEQVFAAGADIKEMAEMSLHRHGQALRRPAVRVHRGGPDPQAGGRRRSPATRSAAAASWRCAPTSGSPPRTPCSASPRSCSGSSPAPAAPSG